MDWFKQNPFVSGLIALTVVLGGVGLYFVSSESAALSEQRDLYAGHTGTLNRLQSSKPFPSEANRAAAEADLQAAEATLKELSAAVGSQSEPVRPLTPEQFQDELSKTVASVAAAATAAGVALPEGFYLGFDDYRAQPPPPEAAPLLGQQLRSVERSISLLIDAGISAVSGVSRPKLAAEGPAAGGAKKADAKAAPKSDLVDFTLAPFDVSFVADQSAFRSAVGAVTTSKPMIFLRLLSVANEQPEAPAKAGAEPQAAAPPADGGEAKASIPVIFGREMLNVVMRLAAISGPAEAAK